MRHSLPAALFLTLVASSSSPLPAQSIDSLLEEGYYLEFARCDPRSALDVYKRVLSSPGLASAVEARVRLRMGVCHEELGEERQAREQFQLIVTRHENQADMARAAQRYLGEVIPEDPARFMPRDTLFYAELVNPGDELINLAEALRGTPFENPVDSSRARGSEIDAPQTIPGDAEDASFESTPPREGTSSIDLAAAFFNRSFFKELSKVGGLAFGIPTNGDAEGAYLGVASLGGSDVLPGIVTSFLTILKPPRVGFVRGLPVYRIDRDKDVDEAPGNADYLAFGGNILVGGRPRRQVEEAVERFFSRGKSLASSPDFRDACSQRPGALLFAYIGPSWLEEEIEDDLQRALVSALTPLLDLEQLGPISARITSTALSDSLRATVEVRTRGPLAGDAWTALSTTELDDQILRVVPPNSVGFLATRLDGAPSRWETLKSNARKLAMGLDPATAAALSRGITDLVTRLETPPRDDLFDSIRSVVIGAVETPRLLAFQAFYIVLELEDRPTTEASLRESLRRITRRSAPRDDEAPDDREFHSEKRRVDSTEYTAHSLELIPGLRLSYVRIDDRYVVSMSDAALADAVRTSSNIERASSRSVPSRASKVLFLRPEAIVRMTSGTALSEEASVVILSEVKRALFYTRERPNGVSLELEMPDLTPTLRAILQRIARSLQKNSSAANEGDR